MSVIYGTGPISASQLHSHINIMFGLASETNTFLNYTFQSKKYVYFIDKREMDFHLYPETLTKYLFSMKM